MKNEMIKDNEVNLQKLLQVKRLETPGDAYFNGFLKEFHRYQRADILKQSSLLERLHTKLQDLFFFQPAKTWAMASGMAAVLVVLSLSVAHFNNTTAASSGLVKLDASSLSSEKFQLVSDSTFERDFSSPRYVTGQTPLSYDSALAF